VSSGESYGLAGREEARNVGALRVVGVRGILVRGLRELIRGLRSFSPGQDGVIGVQGARFPNGDGGVVLGERLGWVESEIGERNGDRCN
jgi:hypothetical protein